MEAENPKIWFKSLTLENVRSFGSRQTIYFTDNGKEDGKPAQWNVILGENGTGKTTVLKAIAILTNPIVHEWIIPLLRTSSPDPGLKAIAVHKDELIELYGGLVIQTHRHSGPFVLHNSIMNNLPKIEQLCLQAYGASRQIGTSGLGSQSLSPISSLFNENSQLINAESWLLEAELDALKNPGSINKYELVKNSLTRLFLDEVSLITSKKIYIANRVYFKTNYGEVLMQELSLGYKTLIAWVVDFAKGLFDRYPNSKDPFSEPAVCLVDEIDLHLHPKFQRNIIQFLTETFPNTQFIVTAHSPLIVQSAEDYGANLILLKREGDETIVVNEPVDVRNWRLDQILSSELFGVEDKNTVLRRERDKLLAKADPTDAEQARIQELNNELDAVPFSNDPYEMKAESLIHQLAEALRNQL